MAELTQTHSSMPAVLSTESGRKQVIGIYGIPGSGKTSLLNLLEQELTDKPFAFYEGSRLIATTVPGGLEAFNALPEQEKVYWRQLAINNFAKDDATGEQVIVIAGHYMFWDEDEEVGTPVITQDDLRTYPHILYLDVTAEIVMKRRQHDTSRDWPNVSVSHLNKWLQKEKADLRGLYYDHGILFTTISDGLQLLDQVSLLLQDFHCHTEANNRSTIREELDDVFAVSNRQLETLLVIDADKTLTAVDTGEVLWKRASEMWPSKTREDPLGGDLQQQYEIHLHCLSSSCVVV